MNIDLSRWLLEFATSDYFIGAASLLLLLFLAKIFFKRRWIPVSDSRFGRIRVSRRALYAVAYAATSSVDGVSGRCVKIAIRRGKICIDIYVRLGACRNVSSVSEDVQGRLSDALISDLGLDNVGRINVVIAGFSRKSYRSGEFSAANCREHCNTKTGDAADEIG